MANIIMSGVYNHFLTTYASPDTSKSDTHKRNELRDIYKSIVRINKDAPLYLLKRDCDIEESAVALKEHTRKFRNSLYMLENEETDGFCQKVAIASDEEAINVTYIGNNKDDVPDLSLEIKKLALPQINTGKFLPSDSLDIQEGSYYFNARIENNNFEFQFSINNQDTNSTMVERIARLINKANVSLSANVLTDEDNNCAIEISSKATGNPENGQLLRFDIHDSLNSPRHGIVPHFGLDNVSQAPSNAIFIVNGSEHNSPTNHFTLGNVFEVELKKETEGPPITIGLKSDHNTIIKNSEKLKDNYNDFVDNLENLTTNSKGKVDCSKIISGLNANFVLEKEPLNKLGLTMNEKGKMNIEKAVMSEFISDSSDPKETLKPLRDFTNVLKNYTTEIMLDPMKYTNRPIVNYKNPGHGTITPYITSEYSGMMFNYYC